jgi:hypothetical protein
MRLYNWAEAFEQRHTLDDIPAYVRKTEIGYWIWLGVATSTGLLGLALIFLAPEGSLKLHFIGLWLLLEGGFMWTAVKVVTHVRLAMYWIIWDRRNRQAAERFTVEAHDL